MAHNPLILASTSPYRRELLARLRLPFQVVAPNFAEVPPPAGRMSMDETRALVLENARGKALSLESTHPGAWILASDQLAECDGRVLEKPGTEENALAQLRFLAGREHRLHTAVVLLHPEEGTTEAEVVTSRLWMKSLSDGALRRYLAAERPFDSAGSYRFEALGVALFERVRTDDPTAIIGLPLLATCRLLEAAGISPLESAAGDAGR